MFVCCCLDGCCFSTADKVDAVVCTYVIGLFSLVPVTMIVVIVPMVETKTQSPEALSLRKPRALKS